MSKGSRAVLFGTCLVAISSSAVLAQPAAPSADPPPADPTAEPTTDPAATPAPTEATPEQPATRYPRSVIDRPLTYPKGVAAVGADVTTYVANSTFFDPALVKLFAGYGITDDFEINFGGYTFPTTDAGKGSLDVNLGYKLVRGAAGGKLEAIARAQTGYNLIGDGSVNPLLLGVHAQYNITPKIAVFTPGQQLSIGLDGDVKPITFSIPVGVGVQATPTVWAQLETTIANIKIKDSENSFIFSDSTPLTLTGYINVMPALDVVLGVGADVTPPGNGEVGDTFKLTAGARYYIGQL